MFKLILSSKFPKYTGKENSAGFTLVEIMITVVIFTVILSSVVVLTADKTPREDLEAKAREIVSLISRAHNYAVSGYQGDAWGVKVLDTESPCSPDSDCVLIFKGTSYARRDTVYDEIVRFNTGALIEASQEKEFYFKKSSGWLSSVSDQTIIIENQFDEQKTVTTTQSGLVYFGD